MQHEEGAFHGVDGVELYYQGWLPDGQPRAAVVICHGVADHSGRYRHLVEALTAADYAVYAHDYRGHGRSGGERLHVERFQLYADDLHAFRALVTATQPGLCLFLFAHSMGAAVALRHVLDHPEGVAGLICSGTALYPGEGFPPLVLKLNELLAAVLPRLRLTGIPTHGLSRDAEWASATLGDPLIHHGPGTTRLGAEILCTCALLRQRLAEITLPLLILQGEQDILVDSRGSRLLYERGASADRTCKFYEGAYHEVFNDLPAAREAFFADVIAWLDARCPAKNHG